MLVRIASWGKSFHFQSWMRVLPTEAVGRFWAEGFASDGWRNPTPDEAQVASKAGAINLWFCSLVVSLIAFICATIALLVTCSWE